MAQVTGGIKVFSGKPLLALPPLHTGGPLLDLSSPERRTESQKSLLATL